MKGKRRILCLVLSICMIFSATGSIVFADETVKSFTVSDFNEFKNAVEDINKDQEHESFVIKLEGDIDFIGEYNAYFKKDTVILGNGHKIDLGSELSYGLLCPSNGATLSLGKENPNGNENDLTITANMSKYGYRSVAFIVIGIYYSNNAKGTLNMYDGVVLEGNKTNGASIGSGVSIENGTFNMYGGSIRNNTNRAAAGMGGAVAGRDNGSQEIIFNMYGGSIHNNVNDAENNSYSGAVMLIGGTFNMYGGSIKDNDVNRANDSIRNYGGGLSLYDSNAALHGGVISGNTGSTYGGGLSHNSSKPVVVNENAVIANNKATGGGADISYYAREGSSLSLSEADKMNVKMTTDNSNKIITGWYDDNKDSRWASDNAAKVDTLQPLSGASLHIVAAYENEYSVTYSFISTTPDMSLPNEVVSLLPNDSGKYKKGDTVTPIEPKDKKVTVKEGTWTFKGYSNRERIIDKESMEFIGEWEFAAKQNIDTNNSSNSESQNGNDAKDNSGNSDEKSAQTGDDSNIAVYGIIALIALAGAAGAVFYGKKKKHH